ncbi:MAG: hypothetical protein DRH43_02510 [Deltaproteobacteria bacterium]|nr:MAG: hypothetical protein DRH50_01820 [Deltaproteobacteria bacterium]RLC12118.1 MAG: hypothetical protein DRH43_02510 [Deltaproteobacteria bacterium]
MGRDFTQLKRTIIRVLTIFFTLGLIAFAMIWGRGYYGSRQAYLEGEKYFTNGNYIQAITFFDRSIHWYTPYSPYVYRSAERLWEICTRAEKQGDIRVALIAARTIKQGFYAARSFYGPGKDWITRSDRKIASLMAKERRKRDGGKDSRLFPGGHENAEPNVFWTLVLEIGLLGWIGSVIGFLLHAVPGAGTAGLGLKPAIFWGVMFAVFYTLWIVGMVMA